MDDDPIYESGIASAIKARDGGFWCGSINGSFLFKFHPSSTVINKGKPFQYRTSIRLAYGGDGCLYMLGSRGTTTRGFSGTMGRPAIETARIAHTTRAA